MLSLSTISVHFLLDDVIIWYYVWSKCRFCSGNITGSSQVIRGHRRSNFQVFGHRSRNTQISRKLWYLESNVQKTIASQWNLQSHVGSQNWPQVNSLGSRGHSSQNADFWQNILSKITSYLIKITQYCLLHRVFLVKALWNMLNLIMLDQLKKWPQVKVKWWPKKVMLHIKRCVLTRKTHCLK